MSGGVGDLVSVPGPLLLLACFIPGIPVQQGSLTKTRWGIRHDNEGKLLPWRVDVQAAAMGQRLQEDPWDGAVSVEMTFVFPRPQTHYGTGRNAGTLKASAPVHHTQKPDNGKLARAILDALTIARIYTDDSRVMDEHPTKRWAVSQSEVPGAHIEVWGVRP